MINILISRKIKKLIASLFVLIILLFASGCGNKSADANKTSRGEANNAINIVGSDTLLQLAASMAEVYSLKNQEADITVAGGGSGTGIASILNGESDIANSSRDIKEKENVKSREMGITLSKFIVARDGLSIIVNKKNNIKKLTIKQVASIFRGELKSWEIINGLDKEINLYGRQSTSGTFEYMREEVVKDDYDPAMRNMEGNQAIIDAVLGDQNGIGYVGAGYAIGAKEKIKILDIAIDGSSEYYSPLDSENITSGNYPITRPLYQIITKKPKVGSLLHDFLLFEMSEEGKKIIIESGYFFPNEYDKKLNSNLLFDK